LVIAGGCTGQDVSGAWHGAFPLPGAKDCRIRIYNSSRFDLTSRDNRWLGAGLWKLDKKKLTFQFLALAEQGEKVAPRTVTVSFTGVGNRLTTELGLWERLH
jgi:hypothetical protein